MLPVINEFHLKLESLLLQVARAFFCAYFVWMVGGSACKGQQASLLLIKLVDQPMSSILVDALGDIEVCDTAMRRLWYYDCIIGTSSTPGWSHSNWLAFFVLGLKRECIYRYGSCSLMARWATGKEAPWYMVHGTWYCNLLIKQDIFIKSALSSTPMLLCYSRQRVESPFNQHQAMMRVLGGDTVIAAWYHTVTFHL